MTPTSLKFSAVALLAGMAAALGACTSSMNTCTQPDEMKPQYGDVDAR